MSEPRPQKPLSLFRNLRDQLEEAFTQLVHEPWGQRALHAAWHPAIDIYETPDAYEVEADLPGVRPQDLRFEVRGQCLTIQGTRRESQWHADRLGVQVERICGLFRRTVWLQHPVDSSAVESSYENGILRLRIPKQS